MPLMRASENRAFRRLLAAQVMPAVEPLEAKDSWQRLCDAVDELNNAMAAHRNSHTGPRVTMWIERDGTGPQQLSLSEWKGRPVQVYP